MSEDNNMRLIGDDCQLFSGEVGEEKTGDGTKTLDELAGGAAASKAGEGYWLITAKASSSSFWPAGCRIGDLYPASGAEVLGVGDKAKLLTLTEIADATGWSMAITHAEVNVTRLSDKFNQYRFGKGDAQITINSIFIVGVTDANKGMVERTMRTFKKAANGTTTVKDIDNSPIYFLGYVRKGEVAGEMKDFVFAKVALSNMTLGGTSGQAQSYDTSARLQSDPVFYSEEVPSAA